MPLDCLIRTMYPIIGAPLFDGTLHEITTLEVETTVITPVGADGIKPQVA